VAANNPIVIGSVTDPHVRAVVDVQPHKQTLVVDADTLATRHYFLDRSGVRIGPWNSGDGGSRGWIRRLTPPDWELGVVIGSHDGAVKASWLTVLAGIARRREVEWLTDLDPLIAAESKLTQLAATDRLGVPAPRTFVTNNVEALADFGGAFVAKPLGPSHYVSDDDRPRTVFAEPFDPAQPADADLLSGTPFIVQERLTARTHLRIVTVRHEAWVFALAADGLPLDWREHEAAHRSWVPAANDELGRLAVDLAEELHVGFSSQDWIAADDGVSYFLDLNPSGQWLFLPDPGISTIARRIAAWLDDDSGDV
jgi:hypothetical protein